MVDFSETDDFILKAASADGVQGRDRPLASRDKMGYAPQRKRTGLYLFICYLLRYIQECGMDYMRSKHP